MAPDRRDLGPILRRQQFRRRRISLETDAPRREHARKKPCVFEDAAVWAGIHDLPMLGRSLRGGIRDEKPDVQEVEYRRVDVPSVLEVGLGIVAARAVEKIDII